MVSSGQSISGKKSSDANSVDPETEVEEEVDQLESDDASPLNPAQDENVGLGPAADRPPGESLLPIVRLENILQADGVTGNLALSKEGLFVLSVATEEFIKRMTQAGQRQATTDHRNAVSYHDMAYSVRQYQEFMFLEDTIPPPMPIGEALKLREMKAKELRQEDPAALSASAHAASRAEPPPSQHSSKFKGKSRATYGVESINGHTNSVSHRRSKPNGVGAVHEPTENADPGGTWSGDQEAQPSQQSFRPKISVPPRSSSNGHANGSLSQSGTATPSSQPQNEYPSASRLAQYSQSSFVSQEDNRPAGQFTGPASAFLQNPGPFGRAAPNPGRTIYSPQGRTD